MNGQRVLVLGATGFIGTHLVDELLAAGYEVVAFSRSAEPGDFPEHVEVRNGDLLEPDTIPEDTFDDIDIVYYLIHSLSVDEFESLDRQAAETFREKADDAGVDRVIYLSGISGDGDLSPHLRSRREVEEVLAEGTFDLTVLRAAIIIGAQSASFRIVKDLVERLPVMIVPRWVSTEMQPIGLADVLEYMLRVLDEPETRGEVYDIGGPSTYSYREFILETADIKGASVTLIPVPVMTPELSSHWLRISTSVQFNIAKKLVESMRHPVTVDADLDLQNVVQIERTPIRTAIEDALTEADA